MISNKYRLCFLALVMVIISMPQSSYAQTSRDSLNQYVADLQKNPNDSALRAKIILLAQTIKPAPAVPDEMERYMVRGKTAIELAKESKDYKNAISEFTKATLAAPWLGNGYFNLAVAQELSADYNSAVKNYRFYLLAEPYAADAKDVKTKTYELEYKNEQADKLEKQKQAVIKAQIAAQQAQEAAKNQRQAWTRSLVPYLNLLYGNRVEKALGNDIGGGVIIGQEDRAEWLQEANHEKKLSTNLLIDNRRFLFSIAGTDNDQIQLKVTDRFGVRNDFYGTPTGIGIDNIIWKLGDMIGTKDDNKEASIIFFNAAANPLQRIIQICYWCKNGVCQTCSRYFLEVKK